MNEAIVNLTLHCLMNVSIVLKFLSYLCLSTYILSFNRISNDLLSIRPLSSGLTFELLHLIHFTFVFWPFAFLLYCQSRIKVGGSIKRRSGRKKVSRMQLTSFEMDENGNSRETWWNKRKKGERQKKIWNKGPILNDVMI